MGEESVIVRLANQLKADGYHSAAAYLLNLVGEDGDGGLAKSVENFLKANPEAVPNLAAPEFEFEVVDIKIGTDATGGATVSGKVRIGPKPGTPAYNVLNGILAVALPSIVLGLKE